MTAPAADRRHGAVPDAEPVADPRYSLLLFVTGASTSSARAIRHVQSMCEEHLSGAYRLTVVDVREEGELARQRRVLATPTLIRETPLPELMRVGDFSDHAAVLAALGLPGSPDG
jgi:circadian clock protein KaiB